MKITRRQLRQIIREALIHEAEFHGETPAGQLTGTEAEDAKFNQQLAAEKTMKEAGLSKPEISQMLKWMKSDDNFEFYDSPQFQKLMYYFADEMPYGVAKARDGEPDIWILDYLNGEIGDLNWRHYAAK